MSMRRTRPVSATRDGRPVPLHSTTISMATSTSSLRNTSALSWGSSLGVGAEDMGLALLLRSEGL